MRKTSPLTHKPGGLLKEILTSVGISVPFVESEPAPQIKKYNAVWDTGATVSAITPKVAKELGLKPIDKQKVSSATNTVLVNVYLVNVLLPSNSIVPGLRVVEVSMEGSDMLIGMDIITLGDFSITNHKGHTCMSFRMPSIHEIDYVKDESIS